jgi:hypothetical protein
LQTKYQKTRSVINKYDGWFIENEMLNLGYSVNELQCFMLRKNGTNSLCTTNGTRGQSIIRLKLPVDIAKTQAGFNNLICLTSIFQIIITTLNQVPNKNNSLQSPKY